MRYGNQADPKSGLPLHEAIKQQRSSGFGANVKRRIALGNFLNSKGQGSDDFSSNLLSAQQFRRLFIKQYRKVMSEQNIDFIICPNSFGDVPPTIDELLSTGTQSEAQLIAEYKMDYFTVVANCLGVPALTMPVSHADEDYAGFPSSVRLQGFFGEDYHLLRCGLAIENILDSL